MQRYVNQHHRNLLEIKSKFLYKNNYIIIYNTKKRILMEHTQIQINSLNPKQILSKSKSKEHIQNKDSFQRIKLIL